MTEQELYNSMKNSEASNSTVGFERPTSPFGSKSHTLNDALPILMRKVYTWMALALAITGIVAYGVASSPALLTALFSNTSSIFILAIAQLGLVWWISARLNKLSLGTATLLFILYSTINGVLFSSIFVIYTMTSIAKVFFITAGAFGLMSLYGYTTKTDLSSLGKILFMALIGLILATIVNIFLKSSAFEMIVSYVAVLIFTGLTAWDTQYIKTMLRDYAYDTSESSQKLALMGALRLYLDFINLFLYLLRIFGSRND